MTKAQHTQGPWIIKPASDFISESLEVFSTQKCSLGTDIPICEVHKCVDPYNAVEANARLIAAAPCLLSELVSKRKALWLAMDELCSAWLKDKKHYTESQQKHMDYFQKELDKADAAIAKATGAA